ncbi:MAG: EscU/YscU/HrcU family type III secretion system export apparatus switch protein [Pirellulales bacterium]|nr:EscU/YscU/HrcU family type III secretion system export apparatus switch protein [Pirellulales bacterium]
MAEFAGEKSFEATAHRRQEAREQGQVVYSQDLGSAALLMLGALLLMMFGGGLLKFCAETMRNQLGQVNELRLTQETLVFQVIQVGYGLGMVLLPILGLMMLGGVFGTVLQIGLLWLPDRLTPDISRISPASGLKRIFSLTGVSKLGFGLFKVLIVGIVASAIVWLRWNDVMRSTGLDTPQFAKFLVKMSLDTALWIGLVLFLLAILDYGLQRWKFEQDLRMTHQEIREEMKNIQGDPQIVSRRRAIQRQMVLNRIATGVPKADVVVTNPTELAIAIQYAPEEMAAPIVVAKGAGVLAQRIRRLALENDIPVVERKPLAQLLYKEVDVGKPVPTETYAAVAEVLAYVYQLKGKKMPAPPKVA